MALTGTAFDSLSNSGMHLSITKDMIVSGRKSHELTGGALKLQNHGVVLPVADYIFK